MSESKFEREQEAQRFKELVEAEQSLDDQAFLLQQKLAEQGVDVPLEVAHMAGLLHELDPYPDNLGDRSSRRPKVTPTNLDDDFDALWYQGRI